MNLSHGLTLALVTSLICYSNAFAQGEIPVGTWRMHTSYNSIVDLAVTPTSVYAAAENGVMVLDREESSVASITRLNGLQSGSITGIDFHAATEQLIVIYADGTFDAVKGNNVSSYDPSATSVITGSKTIHDITIHNNLAYLATDYGIIVFDLSRSEIKETWRNIGDNGTKVSVTQGTIHADSIFLATGTGIIAGDLDDNLLDYHNWKRFEINGMSQPVSLITSFKSTVFAVLNGDGVYEYDNGEWQKASFLDNVVAKSMTSSADYLFISSAANVFRIDTDDNVTTITDETFHDIQAVKSDTQGNLWFGDNSSGLISQVGNSFTTYKANGPTTTTGLRLRSHDGKIFLLPGGYNTTLSPLRINGEVSVFEKGLWSVVNIGVSDPTDIEVLRDGKHAFSSFGFGVKVIAPDQTEILYDENNSTLSNLNAPQRFVNISSMYYDQQDLWVTNYGAVNALHKFKADGTWQSITLPFLLSRYPLDLTADYAGRIWMRINPENGGGLVVYNPFNEESRYLFDADNNGELPSANVRAIEADRDGYIWVGTDRGAAYFFDFGSDAVRPIVGNIYLLLDDRVTAIKTDGGNRKWMGTQRGVWLMNATGEEPVHHFTTENSPLPSDTIVDIEINHKTGEVFFLTSKGLVSYRGDATESDPPFNDVKIFPNPVASNYTGQVGISGLAKDAWVKITDVTGRLVWQGRANGGATSWNVTTAGGRRVSTGMYLVFAATGNGSESLVGKVAVIN